LLSDVQSPKGGTFAAVTSDTTPTGVAADTSVPVALNEEVAVPYEHFTVAPVRIRFGTAASLVGSRQCTSGWPADALTPRLGYVAAGHFAGLRTPLADGFPAR
jgi:hypothetical protein